MKRFTLQEREALLSEYERSQCTQADFVTRKGIGLSTLQNWLRADRRQGRRVQQRGRLREIPLAAVLGASPWSAEVVSPQGWRVRVGRGASADEIAELLRGLPC